MSMFCYQCQETARNQGCTVAGVCGKKADTANLMDLLVFVLRGVALEAEAAQKRGRPVTGAARFIRQALFATITNANFDSERIADRVRQALELRTSLRAENGDAPVSTHPAATWHGRTLDEFHRQAAIVGVRATENEDIRSLRELIVYGLKGIAAYADHADHLGFHDEAIDTFLVEALAATTRDLAVGELVDLVMRTGQIAVATMALLDQANTTTYGHPELTRVNIGVRNRPGILISGHDLKDMAELLAQTEGTGIDVYTHSEMLPANYYPAFKKYAHFVGNYGGSWWHQKEEFEAFNGPILMTTNCIVPVRESYRHRIFTTGQAGYPGVTHLPDPPDGERKDFTRLIELARGCAPPTELETGEIVGGFAHHQVLALADRVVEAVKSGAIKRFVVMAGCDGRQGDRQYFTEVAQALPADTVILTAGCAKYRYNKLPLGDIGGIPRVLDAGQCNDSYSLAVIALKLKEVFGLADINELPLSFDIAWYEQKAVAVLLALLYLGVKGIRVGPTLPAFLSPGVAKVLIERFDLKPTGQVAEDVAAMMAGH